MTKKIILRESDFNEYICGRVMERLLNEANMSKSEINGFIKDAIKNDREVKKEIEKTVREIVASSVNILFKTLWQRRNFYEDDIKRG